MCLAVSRAPLYGKDRRRVVTTPPQVTKKKTPARYSSVPCTARAAVWQETWTDYVKEWRRLRDGDGHLEADRAEYR